jgi:hypothetical protein
MPPYTRKRMLSLKKKLEQTSESSRVGSGEMK